MEWQTKTTSASGIRPTLRAQLLEAGSTTALRRSPL